MNSDRNLHGLIPREAKKISINLDESTLLMIDELAGGLKTTRTMIINGLIGQGMKKFVSNLRFQWNNMKKEGRKDPKKVDNLLKFLSDFEKKWQVDNFP